MKPWYTSKTIWLAIATGAVAVLGAFNESFKDLISPGLLGFLAALQGFLRAITKEAVSFGTDK